jgi:squalene monooxygenase
MILPQLPSSVHALFKTAVEAQEPVCMATKYLPTATEGCTGYMPEINGALLLGDSWNMRHPITGGGMTVALLDVENLANRLSGKDLAALCRSGMAQLLREFRSSRRGHAGAINLLANALYRVFSVLPGDMSDVSVETQACLREACLDYFRIGGPCCKGPVSLLAGLTPSPAILITHFFWVAALGMKKMLAPYPTQKRLYGSWELLKLACSIIMPLLKQEGVTALSLPLIQRLLVLLIPWTKTGRIEE